MSKSPTKLFGSIGVGLAALALSATPAMAQSADWVKSVARAIAAKQTYPRTAQMRGEEGTAKVKVYISASGAVERTELVGPSGSATLDKEALALPTRAGTLPAPPGGATSVTVPITWKLL
ncbi:energy transducer TonB [Novosphingobium cyanobacteriorum]|uniref:TonB family protein n=1 Tax=Novosphingobium cyanobacteriorum TaxID=3024215 RepID=A0ABT6CEV4_9SPHN|nr:TonB family protein [Novosphingobium cyanobacteriorum]MDF8332074.1 TonB family protein [Novosphingobium cyanobacteriorum]